VLRRLGDRFPGAVTSWSTLGGFNVALSARVSGDASCRFSVNSAPFLLAAPVEAGDSVQLHVHSAATAAAARACTLTVSTTSDSWSVTTAGLE
jgi:hypothetical protein